MDKLEQKITSYLDLYGLDTLNLVIRRHNLSSEKRHWFSIRFVLEDKEKEMECTNEMNRLSAEIEEIDRQLESVGIHSKNRPTITKDLKKHFKDGSWVDGLDKVL